MESLTHALARKAHGIIEEVEKLGGMTKAIEAGMPKLRIEKTAARRQARIDRGEDVIVGVNKFKLPEEPEIDTREIDNKAVSVGNITDQLTYPPLIGRSLLSCRSPQPHSALGYLTPKEYREELAA